MSSNSSIIISIVLSILLETLVVGTQYTGSREGNILYIVSFLFLVAFVLSNIRKRQELNSLTNNKLYPLITIYILSFPFIYIISSFEHPSGFLISLFFLYFFLAITWTVLVGERRVTNISILLFLLCLIPIAYGIYIHSNYEEQINQDVLSLEVQKEYYDDHLGNIILGKDLGILPELDTISIEKDIENLGEGLVKARKYYQDANYNKCSGEIKRLNHLNEKLKGDFEWLGPEKKVSDELHDAAKGLIWRYERYCQLMSNVTSLTEDNNSTKIISNLEEIGYEISMVREKLNIAWNSYKNEEYEKSYKYVMEVKAEYYGDFREIDRKMEMGKYQIGGAT